MRSCSYVQFWMCLKSLVQLNQRKKVFSFVSGVNLNYEQMYFEFLLKNVVLLINKGVASFSA